MAESAAMVWRQYRLERRMFWRNPSAAFFNFALPLVILFFLGAILSGNQKALNIIVPGIAGMSVVSTTFTALAFNMTFLREQGILKRIHGTPLRGGTYLSGIALSAVTNTVVQVAIITIAGKVFFGLPWPQNWPELVIFVAVGVVAFATLGVAYAHVIPNFDSAPAYVNAVFLPLIFISGVFFDAQNAPPVLRDIGAALPLTRLIDGLSGAMVTGQGLADNLTSLAVLSIWAIAGTILAIRGFSWEQRRT